MTRVDWIDVCTSALLALCVLSEVGMLFGCVCVVMGWFHPVGEVAVWASLGGFALAGAVMFTGMIVDAIRNR